MDDRRSELEAHIARIDQALAEAEPREVAGLLRERRITLREIAEVPKSDGKSIRDDVAAKRAARRASAAAAQTPAARRNKRSG